MAPRTDFKETPWYKRIYFKKLGSLLGSLRSSQTEEKEEIIASTTSTPTLQSLFDMLPDDPLKEIARWLPDQPPPPEKSFLSYFLSSQKNQSPVSALMCSAKRFHLLLQPDSVANNFRYCVVYGNQKKAEALLVAYPHLLSLLLQQKGQVIDYPGHTIYGTALQIALGAEDVKFHDNEECMAEMLLRYLRQLPKGETIIDKQIAEQFPAGWREEENARIERDLVELKKVVATLENAPDMDNCADDIKAFQNYLDDENKNRGVITKGKHFNMQLLIDALTLFVKKFDLLGGRWDSPKNILFWRKIIGYIERYIPTCYAQALCQGVPFIVMEGKKLTRRLTFAGHPDVSYYPRENDPTICMGEDYSDYPRTVFAAAMMSFVVLSQTKATNVEEIMQSAPIIRQRIGMS